LLDEFIVAKGEEIFKKVMKKYKKVDLLIIDDLLLHGSNNICDFWKIVWKRN
jgi:DNA replication protein DnaC